MHTCTISAHTVHSALISSLPCWHAMGKTLYKGDLKTAPASGVCKTTKRLFTWTPCNQLTINFGRWQDGEKKSGVGMAYGYSIKGLDNGHLKLSHTVCLFRIELNLSRVAGWQNVSRLSLGHSKQILGPLGRLATSTVGCQSYNCFSSIFPPAWSVIN